MTYAAVNKWMERNLPGFLYYPLVTIYALALFSVGVLFVLAIGIISLFAAVILPYRKWEAFRKKYLNWS